MISLNTTQSIRQNYAKLQHNRQKTSFGNKQLPVNNATVEKVTKKITKKVTQKAVERLTPEQLRARIKTIAFFEEIGKKVPVEILRSVWRS